MHEEHQQQTAIGSLSLIVYKDPLQYQPTGDVHQFKKPEPQTYEQKNQVWGRRWLQHVGYEFQLLCTFNNHFHLFKVAVNVSD